MDCIPVNQKSFQKYSLKISFTIATKMVRCQGINLIKSLQDLYGKIYETLLKDFERDLKKWRDIACSEMEIIF